MPQDTTKIQGTLSGLATSLGNLSGEQKTDFENSAKSQDIYKGLQDASAALSAGGDLSSATKNLDYMNRQTVPRPIIETTPAEATSTAQTPEQIQSTQLQLAQGQINSLRDYERSQLEEQRAINENNDRSTQSISTLTGLAGSTEANVAQQATTAAGQKANQSIRAETEMKVQAILGKIREDAVTEARNQRLEARQTEQDRIANRAARQKEAADQLTNLAAGGVTYEGLKTSDPEAFKHLSESFGGEQALKGAFVLNTPQDQILDKRLENGKYVIAKQNPVTGKVTVETLDLGLPANYTKTIDAGNRLLAMPENWDGDPSKLITIEKGVKPGTASTSGTSTQYSNDLDAIIGATLSTIPTKFGQQTFTSQLGRARNDSDKINLVASQVLKGQSSELKADFANQASAVQNIDKALALIDSGVKTGALQAGKQYAYNVVGKDFDPNLARVNQYITAAIQPYRNSVTGAAWGDQEDAEYQNLFGSTKYEPAALRERLTTVKEILKAKSAEGLNAYVNPLGYYDNPFETGNNGTLRSPDGTQEVDTSSLTPEQVQEAKDAGWQ